MGFVYSKREREAARRKFASMYRKGGTVADCCEAAGISVATARAWNGGAFAGVSPMRATAGSSGVSGGSKSDSWSKGDGWSK